MSNLQTPAAQFSFLGTTDAVTTCGCCDKTGLKATVALRHNETGETVYFGSVCGARAIGWGVKDFNKAAKEATDARDKAAARLFGSIFAPVKTAAFMAVCAVGGGFTNPAKQAVIAEWAPKQAAAYEAAIAAVLAAYPDYNTGRFYAH